jgi:hypothetical protein
VFPPLISDCAFNTLRAQLVNPIRTFG